MRKKAGMTVAAKVLQQETKRRFQHFIDPTDECFEPLYLMTTALDPRFTLILTSEQTEAAEAELTNLLSMSSEDTTTTSIEEAGSEGMVTEQDQPPPLKRFRYLSGIVSDKRQERTGTSQAQQPALFSKFSSRR